MTDETQIVPIRPLSPLPPFEAQALAAEIAKCLKLVAPSSMGAEQQTVWLHSAVDALQDIRASEVAAISFELRRKVTRAAQIVPEIANLVAQRRARSVITGNPPSPFAEEIRIDNEALKMRQAAGSDRAKIQESWEWERQARLDAGLRVVPPQKPFTAAELKRMSPAVVSLGIKCGFLKRENGMLVET